MFCNFHPKLINQVRHYWLWHYLSSSLTIKYSFLYVGLLTCTHIRLKKKIFMKDNFCFLSSTRSQTFTKPTRLFKSTLRLPHNHKIMQIFTKTICSWQKTRISLIYLKPKCKHCQYFEQLLKTSHMNCSHQSL
jgi:hypothetical protein